jgi:hypothetical protein
MSPSLAFDMYKLVIYRMCVGQNKAASSASSGARSLVLSMSRQENTHQRSSSLRLDHAINTDLAAMPFDKLLGDK